MTSLKEQQSTHKVPPLSPPPTEDELAWWKRINGPIAKRQILWQSAPFLVSWLVIDWIRSKSSVSPGSGIATVVHAFVVVPLLSALLGLSTWRFSEKHWRNRHIRWKRVRDELGVAPPSGES